VTVLLFNGLDAQVSTRPELGIPEHDWRLHALVGATVYTEPGEELNGATVIVRNGSIVAVGVDIATPEGSRVWELNGKVVYAGFIDAYTHLGLPAGLRPAPQEPHTEPDAGVEEAHARAEPRQEPAGGSRSWNKQVRSERRMADYLDLTPRENARHRSLGFTTALVAPGRGIIAGESVLANLTPNHLNDGILNPAVAQHIRLWPGGKKSSSYPRSLMGRMAVIRQTFHDADWYASARDQYAKNPAARERPVYNASLEALGPMLRGERAVFAESGDELGYARISKILAEFKLSAAILGNGYEYRVRDKLKAAGHTVILPLDFPDAPDVESTQEALEVSLQALQHWELAPSNAAFLEASGIPFCISAYGLDSPAGKFWEHLRLSVSRGLGESTALAALTTRPAKILGASETLGRVAKGSAANLVVASGNLFNDEDARILTVWIDGHPYPIDADKAIDPRGAWAIVWHGADGPVRWDISGELTKLRAESGDESFSVRIEGEQVLLTPPASLFGFASGTATFAGYLHGDRLTGSGELPDGHSLWFSANRFIPEDEPERPDRTGEAAKIAVDIPALVFEQYPAGAFGRIHQPARPNGLLIKNATIWTSGDQGVLENADLLVMAGKIIEVGKALQSPEYSTVIDASGKHLTAGLIDSHSHVAISGGVNEGTHAVSLEVRVEDATDPTDIGIYRQLSGGLTTANVLHGSSNPLGGQTAVIKLRWGEDANGLKFAEAPPSVKMALGENVKQRARRGTDSARYPQTRMGVEQIIRGIFMAAREYESDWAAFRSGGSGLQPRRNLQLDAALEMLNRDRIVHVHAYRQDEILMFVRLAEEFSLSVGAFHHVLEGYKIADAIASIGAGASTFPDWWAYKFESFDAIPQNGAVMHREGIVTSFHSDDNEIAQRLNTEAAKAVRYGGLSEEEALALITINPARQLGVEQWVGSLEPGKDADFVIWNGNPLSTLSLVDQTWIDGRKYFDSREDIELRAAVIEERQRLIQKVLSARVAGGSGNGRGKPNRGDDLR